MEKLAGNECAIASSASQSKTAIAHSPHPKSVKRSYPVRNRPSLVEVEPEWVIILPLF
ncbi:hypothetical protein NDI49_05380 [Trichocoleus sp. ST-U3]